MKKSVKKLILKVVRILLKFVLPAVVGWLEGDTHAIADALTNLISIL